MSLRAPHENSRRRFAFAEPRYRPPGSGDTLGARGLSPRRDELKLSRSTLFSFLQNRFAVFEKHERNVEENHQQGKVSAKLFLCPGCIYIYVYIRSTGFAIRHAARGVQRMKKKIKINGKRTKKKISRPDILLMGAVVNQAGEFLPATGGEWQSRTRRRDPVNLSSHRRIDLPYAYVPTNRART